MFPFQCFSMSHSEAVIEKLEHDSLDYRVDKDIESTTITLARSSWAFELSPMLYTTLEYIQSAQDTLAAAIVL
jgi:hypothetical protein